MHPDDGDRYIGASELARLGYCERQVAFDARHGPCDTAEQEAARERGRQRHAHFYEESRRTVENSARKGGCFVATLALGEGPETRQLRAYRDLVLRRSAAGRWLVGCYYRLSPALCRWLADKPRLLALVRRGLRRLAYAAGRAVDRRTGARP
ncbi:CFI-box-CTERM domain-containing protein [Azohydromonas aeria]|uniref:CFI-box-CTERM domain-containing protein n=1 Tax=Azohydromonas aeria TaxID=2590212 RepID=UPI0012FCF6DE|nr:CFI-box-CTERM domain-containing protein [Azohydromonas aeria]